MSLQVYHNGSAKWIALVLLRRHALLSRGELQVSLALIGALVWQGTANNATSLHSFLTDLGVVVTEPVASDINDHGVIVGTALESNKTYVVMWTPAPPTKLYRTLRIRRSNDQPC